FRPVAAISAAVVIATGVIASMREVQHRYFLLWSAYGRFLLAKWALVAGMLVLGGLAGRALARGTGGAAPATAAGAAKGRRRAAPGSSPCWPIRSRRRPPAACSNRRPRPASRRRCRCRFGATVPPSPSPPISPERRAPGGPT